MNDAGAGAIGIDPITVEVIGSALASITDEMGEALIRASYSTNIKERRDCSTALFDIHGDTLCQAEHIPMHLGSFIGLIPHILKRHPIEHMQPGDAVAASQPVAVVHLTEHEASGLGQPDVTSRDDGGGGIGSHVGISLERRLRHNPDCLDAKGDKLHGFVRGDDREFTGVSRGRFA